MDLERQGGKAEGIERQKNPLLVLIFSRSLLTLGQIWDVRHYCTQTEIGYRFVWIAGFADRWSFAPAKAKDATLGKDGQFEDSSFQFSCWISIKY